MEDYARPDRMRPVDVEIAPEALASHSRCQDEFAVNAADCAVELREGGFGLWWTDRPAVPIDARVVELAHRLETRLTVLQTCTRDTDRSVEQVLAADAAAAEYLQRVAPS